MMTLYKTFEDGLDRLTMLAQQQNTATYGTVFLVEHNPDGTHKASVLESQVVTPEHFGATGDGIEDDTTHIQAAIDSLVTTGGVVLLHPEKRYRTTQPLTITTSMIGFDSYIPGWFGQYGAQIVADHDDNIIEIIGTAYGSEIQGNFVRNIAVGREHTTSTTGAGIYAKWVSRLDLKNIVIFNCRTGIYAFDWLNCTVEKFNIVRHFNLPAGTSYGIYFDPETTDNRYWSNRLINGFISWPLDGTWAGTAFGILGSGPLSDLLIRDVEASGDYGIYLDQTGTSGTDLQIVNPVVDSYKNVGIYIKGYTSASIVGGWVAPTTTGATTTNVQIYSASGVTITGLQSHGESNNGYARGILVNSSNNVAINASTFRGEDYPIELDSNTDLAIVGNNFYSSSSKPSVNMIDVLGTNVGFTISGNVMGGYATKGINVVTGAKDGEIIGNRINPAHITTPISNSGTNVNADHNATTNT
jgi:hypothetical protein